jgi:hypothetical protein
MQYSLVQGNRICHPNMTFPSGSLLGIVALFAFIFLGLAGIHLKTHIGPWSKLILIVPSIATGFFVCTLIQLIIFSWLYDFLSSCPDGEGQELITADESDAALEMFERLKSALKPFFFFFYPFFQIMFVFSLYNTIQGIS